jgi:nitroreductase/NAD-dependent dihydropyrimidine dehydrogenase PreA subunit
MLHFEINAERCIRCGWCAADCPAQVIALHDDFPFIPKENESACIRCQHCLAVCPTGAVSILGVNPDESRLLARNFPDPEQLETLIKGRRSVRRYREENLDPALLQRLLEVSLHAPTGINARQVRFTVIDDRERLADFRRQTYAALVRLRDGEGFPENLAYFGDLLRLWEENGTDVLFRGAPHLLVASAPRSCPAPLPDCLIALAYFELLAQSHGVGTVWDGMAKRAIDELVPGQRERLGIPDDHLVGYVMVFGQPAVSYHRTVQRGPAQIVRLRG